MLSMASARKANTTIINATFLFTTLNNLYKRSIKGTLHTQ